MIKVLSWGYGAVNRAGVSFFWYCCSFYLPFSPTSTKQNSQNSLPCSDNTKPRLLFVEIFLLRLSYIRILKLKVQPWKCVFRYRQSNVRWLFPASDYCRALFRCSNCAQRFGLHSFGVIRIQISDPRSVWIVVHQRKRWVRNQSGFAGSFNAPWSRQILVHWSGSGSPQRNAALITASSAILGSLEEPPNIWLTVAKNAFVGWALNLESACC